MTQNNNKVKKVREVIAKSAKKSGRSPEDITLIAVTKTVKVEQINEVLAAGVQDIGENRVQEMLPKYEQINEENIYSPNWHFIGNLQKNKIKFIADKVNLIHSVNSLSLAAEINKHAAKLQKKINVLLEVNIANEHSKMGISPDEVIEYVRGLTKFCNLQFTGLMCIAPYVENPERNRLHFEKMYELKVDIIRNLLYSYDSAKDMFHLSMGMSGDYGVAIEEGSTMVRIGTALFDERI